MRGKTLLFVNLQANRKQYLGLATLLIVKYDKMSGLDSDTHLVALKVMRLTRPALVLPGPIVTCESSDLPQRLPCTQENDGIVGYVAEELAAGQILLLPQSFGNIYLGETFSSYICVHNCTTHSVEFVTVKADLQSNTSRINLPMHKNKKSPVILAPDETLDDVIQYEVKEIGTHILVCEVSYTSPAGFAQSLRKFFKFQVLKPLDVKTKFYNAEMDDIYLEAQIQNVTTGPFCLEKVELDSNEHYTVTPLNTLPNGESVLTSKNMLNSSNSCQFLYCIKPNPSIAKRAKALRQFINVGKLDIVWRSNLGEKGRLQTSQLNRLSFEHKDICLEVLDADNIVKIGTVFSFLCRVTNNSEHTIKLEVGLDTKIVQNCTYTGSADFSLDPLLPAESTEFILSICPSTLGLIRVSPLLLVDTLNNRQYIIEKVVDVFVVDIDYHQDDVFLLNKLIEFENQPGPKIQKKVQLQVV